MRLGEAFWDACASAQRSPERPLGMEGREVAVVVLSSLSRGYSREVQRNVFRGATTVIDLRT